MSVPPLQALPLELLRQRSSTKWRSYGDDVIPMFVAETDFPLAPAITAALGPAVGVAFGIGLLASGLASTSVGSYAGSAIMGGLLHVRIPVFTRRLITLIPALVIIAVGVDPTWALVLSQVLLSLGIPFALIPLVRLSSNRDLMGAFVNKVALTVAAWVVVALIVSLNLALIILTATGAD